MMISPIGFINLQRYEKKLYGRSPFTHKNFTQVHLCGLRNIKNPSYLFYYQACKLADSKLH